MNIGAALARDQQHFLGKRAVAFPYDYYWSSRE
jgi:hypothetical protein